MLPKLISCFETQHNAVEASLPSKHHHLLPLRDVGSRAAGLGLFTPRQRMG